MKRFSWPVVLLLFFAGRCPVRAGAEDALTFEKDVRPILKTHCFRCHGEGDKLKGKLDLRLRRLAVTGGKSGPALVPGNPDGSSLYRRLREGEMPPGKKKPSDAEVAIIGRWIAAGAKTARPEPAGIAGSHITAEERNFWSFQPIRRPPVPTVRHADRVRTPLDAFLLARLEQQGLSFATDADKSTLIRRATFDLLGLPPSPEEVDCFLADSSPDAYEKLIDRLLASPHYGERFGRHWLDVAGYADSEGYTNDTVRPHAYKYRDYVIRAINADRPFDQFLQEQLAGDEMVRPPYRDLSPQDVERLTATGFLRMAPDGTASPGVNLAEASNQVLADTLKAVSIGLLGLTVGCAQCHDHRHDPIPQTDYYRLRAIFEPAYDPAHWRSPPMRRISLSTDADRARARQIEIEAARIDQERLSKQQEYIERTFEAELKKLPEGVREAVRAARGTPPAKRTPQQKRLLDDYPSVNVTAGSLYLYDPKAAADLKKYVERAAAVRATKPPEDYLRALTEVPGQVPATRLFVRGDISQPGQALAPGGLSVLDDVAPLNILERDSKLPTTGRRLAFARWLTSERNPLTPRVLVNRVWMHHFGKGLVGTPGDFGTLGERPSHPELLDWLASDFTAGGWRLKRLHRLIMLSTAYRQASQRHPAGERVDPDDRLLWRMPLRRLQAEEVRDGMLAISGKINPKMLGPAVPVMEDEVGQFVVGIENKNGENRPGPVLPLHGEEFRRSVYVQVYRSRPLSLLEAFDMPVMEPTCPARSTSTVAPQALLLMNNDFVVAQAEAFADRVRREAGPDLRAQVSRAWRLAFAREPSSAEVSEALAFLSEQSALLRSKPAKGQPDTQARALASFCQTLLSANQFLYVD
jgi:hypothetical protein